MNLLAIDTATESCSAALVVDGKYFYQTGTKPRLHAELILPFIEEVLDQAQITKKEISGLIVGQGPGAFTGVRIGVAVAQGLALAWDIPVVGVSNLMALANKVYLENKLSDGKIILVATDARMNEVYWCKYLVENQKITAITDQIVSKAADVALTGVDYYMGNGFSVYPELQDFAKKHRLNYNHNVHSQALDMLKMMENDFDNHSENIETIKPVYLREP